MGPATVGTQVGGGGAGGPTTAGAMRNTRWYYTHPCVVGNRDATTFSTTSFSTTTTSSSSSRHDDSWRWPVDVRLLVRAQRQSQAWHNRDPQHFPWHGETATTTTTTTTTTTKKHAVEHDDKRHADGERDRNDDDPELDQDNAAGKDKDDDHHRRLRTGTSLILCEPFVVVDRTRALQSRTHQSEVPSRHEWPSRYRFDLPRESRASDPCQDDNEIELDGEIVDGETIPQNTTAADENGDSCPTQRDSSVDLICLGTGCAAPSAYRGASGYVITLDESNAFVFEVGEGFVTQWNRYSGQSLLTVRMIWISHAQ